MRRLLLRADKRLVRRWRYRSGSGKGWHVYVLIDPPCRNPMELVALQAILGSDCYREACNAMRARTLMGMSAQDQLYWGSRFNVLYDGGW